MNQTQIDQKAPLCITKRLQITTFVFLVLAAISAAWSILYYRGFVMLTALELHGCDSCVPGAEGYLGWATTTAIFTSVFAGGSGLGFAMDRKGEYLHAHRYL